MATAPRRATRPQRRKRHLRLIPGGASGSDKRRATPKKRRSTKAQPRRSKGQATARPRSKPSIKTSTRLAGVLSLLAIVATVFGLVFMNIAAAEGSFRLEELKARTAIEESRYLEMRYEVASKEAPAHVEMAAKEIGMVPPSDQRYIVGPPGTTEPGGSSDNKTWEMKAVVQGP